MAGRIRTGVDIASGLAALAVIEPRFGPLIEVVGEVPLRLGEPGFVGVCRIIVSQQVSVASARAIWARLSGRYPTLCHHDILGATEADLRGCGLSGPKIRTLNAVAHAVGEKRLDFGLLETATPGEVHAILTAISGVGPWTADIYLMFHLGHADVFAPGDLALQEALKTGFGLETRPDAKTLAAIAESWSPWRAVAARLLWAYYARMKLRDGINA